MRNPPIVNRAQSGYIPSRRTRGQIVGVSFTLSRHEARIRFKKIAGAPIRMLGSRATFADFLLQNCYARGLPARDRVAPVALSVAWRLRGPVSPFAPEFHDFDP